MVAAHTDFDADAARLRYAEEETDELVRIAFVDSAQYVPEAVQLAKEELALRGVHGRDDARVVAAVAAVKAAAKKEHEAQDQLAHEPLGVGYKIACFIFPDIIAIIIVWAYWASGKKRAARQALKWMGLGWLSRIVAIFIILSPWSRILR